MIEAGAPPRQSSDASCFHDIGGLGVSPRFRKRVAAETINIGAATLFLNNLAGEGKAVTRHKLVFFA